MNKTIETFARESIRTGIKSLPDECQTRFKLMYSEPRDPDKRTPEVVRAIKIARIDDVIDSMRDSELDHALSQVQATIEKLS